MEYRNFGRTGVKVSQLCLGCMNFGGRTEPEDSYKIIDRAIEAGINILDTSNSYSKGGSETVVGDALKQNGKRERIVLCTKVWGVMDRDDPNARGPSRRHIIDQCDKSLKRLQTDWIDIYQIHKPQHDVAIDETLRAMDDLVRAGKVRYIGTTTFPAWRLVESIWASKELGLNRFVSEQPLYHMLDRRIEAELIPFAQTYGYGLIPWSPLAGGFLTGKYKGDKQPESARLAPGGRRWDMLTESEGVKKVIDLLEALAKEKNATMSQVALAWNYQQPGITSPIIGPRTMEQLEDNLGALEVEVTDDDRERIDQVSPPGQCVVPYVTADWAPTTYRWQG